MQGLATELCLQSIVITYERWNRGVARSVSSPIKMDRLGHFLSQIRERLTSFHIVSLVYALYIFKYLPL